MSDLAGGKRRPRKAYIEAKKTLLSYLNTPEFTNGDQIPPERELVALLGVSRMTLRKILAELVEGGILERRGNQGTWLRQATIARPLTTPVEQGIGQITEMNGAKAGSQLLYFQHAPASTRIARWLQIQPGDPVVVIKRLRLADDEPFCLETSYLPGNRVPGMTGHMLEQQGSLYKLLAEFYHLHAASDNGSVQVGRMNEEEHTLLQVPPDSPSLVYRGTISDGLGIPLEYLVSVNHPERVVFNVQNRGIVVAPQSPLIEPGH
ncbi:GntR family transcriptional regulator [Mangrovibacter sp. MFB070]|uniref:GntR family transcriptional regulator n=1 Tax=Mangrovibacter sp. MFB070 TaxID=1224318 RepID=UPI0004D8C3CE|nr:GntR family transcriptional regulator [Mangrovibacter sp. MFB070]KEA52251.1 GntR family transcriptional regulator [Mangrovibacter sp. MFB070]